MVDLERVHEIVHFTEASGPSKTPLLCKLFVQYKFAWILKGLLVSHKVISGHSACSEVEGGGGGFLRRSHCMGGGIPGTRLKFDVVESSPWLSVWHGRIHHVAEGLGISGKGYRTM